MTRSNSLPQSVALTRVLMAILAIGLVMQILVVFRLEINFDEFYTYNRSFELLRGDVQNPLQTLLLRGIQWAHVLPGNEIDQIIGTRVMMFGFALITCFCIYKTARRYASVTASLYAVFAYIGFYPVFLNMTAIRVDGTVTMLLMLAVYLVSDPKQNWRNMVAIGFLMGLAGMITMKSVFYTPIIAAFLIGNWARSGWSRKEFFNGVIAFLTATITLVVIYYLHDPSTGDTGSSANYLNSMASKSLFEGGFLPNPSVIFHGIFVSPIWIFIVLGFVGLIWQLARGDEKSKTLAIALFAFPILTVFFYLHAYPYYYVFIMAPGVIVAAIAFDKYFSKDRILLYSVVIGMQFVLMSTVFVKAMTKTQDYQRDILNVVHDIFPETVSYIDYCGMVPSHDRIVEGGIFISPDSFKMQEYFENGPIMDGILRKHQPKYILANASSLDFADEFTHPFSIDLLGADVETLKSNYVRFWGPIYVPGKIFSAEGEFEIIIEGTYTIKTSETLTLDGDEVVANQAIYLSAGTHSVSGDFSASAKLVWGDNLTAPEEGNIPDYMFFGF